MLAALRNPVDEFAAYDVNQVRSNLYCVTHLRGAIAALNIKLKATF